MRMVGSWSVLASISIGAALGALARWGLAQALPAARAGFPWATFLINATGCLLIGVLMVLVAEVWSGQRLLRPFLGTGVLGGYTTFSTYAVDVVLLVQRRAWGTAVAYLMATVAVALAAVWAGTVAARWAIRPRLWEAE